MGQVILGMDVQIDGAMAFRQVHDKPAGLVFGFSQEFDPFFILEDQFSGLDVGPRFEIGIHLQAISRQNLPVDLQFVQDSRPLAQPAGAAASHRKRSDIVIVALLGRPQDGASAASLEAGAPPLPWPEMGECLPPPKRGVHLPGKSPRRGPQASAAESR